MSRAWRALQVAMRKTPAMQSRGHSNRAEQARAYLSGEDLRGASRAALRKFGSERREAWGSGGYFRRLLSASYIALGLRVAAAGVGLAMNIAVTRVCGPDEAGLFFLGQGCLVVLAMLARCGADHALIRIVAGFWDQGHREAATGAVLRCGLVCFSISLLASGCLLTAAEPIARLAFGKPEFAGVLRWTAFALVPFSGSQLLAFAVQGRGQVAMATAITALYVPAALLLTVLLGSLFSLNSASQLMAVLFVIATLNFVLSVCYWTRHAGLRIDVDAMDWGDFRASTLPLFWVSVFALAHIWVPQLILGAYDSAEQFARFNNAYKVAMLISLLLMALNSVAAPQFAVLSQRGKLCELRELAAWVNGVIILAALPILASLFILAPRIMSVFDPTFSSDAGLLRILIAGQFVNAICGNVGHLLTMTGNECSFRNSMAAAAVVGITLALVLIPRWGAIGAAVSLAAAMTAVNCTAAWFVYRRLGINVARPNLRGAFALLIRSLKPAGT